MGQVLDVQAGLKVSAVQDADGLWELHVSDRIGNSASLTVAAYEGELSHWRNGVTRELTNEEQRVVNQWDDDRDDLIAEALEGANK